MPSPMAISSFDATLFPLRTIEYKQSISSVVNRVYNSHPGVDESMECLKKISLNWQYD